MPNEACLLFTALFFLLLARDLFPRVLNRLRARRGAFSGDEPACFEKMSAVARRWLLHPPLVPVSDSSRWLLVDDLINGKLRTEVRRGWPMGLLAKGIMVADIHAGGGCDLLEQFYSRYLTAAGSFRVPLKNVDDALHGEVLLYLYKKTGKSKYRAAVELIANWLLDRYRRSQATLPYRDGNSVRFVDTLGMIVPFLLEFDAQFSDKTARELATLQMEEFVTHAVDAKSGLPFHAYNAEYSNIPTGLFSWGRGVGWYVLGLVDILIRFQPETGTADYFVSAFKRLAATLRKMQKSDGGWGAIVNVSSSRYDSSATAMIVYACQRAMAAGFLERAAYQEMLSRGISRLRKSTTLDGVVQDSQGACMGLNRHSHLFSPTPYAQGMALAAVAVMIFAKDCPKDMSTTADQSPIRAKLAGQLGP